MTRVRLGDKAPDFRLMSYKGVEVSLSDFKGKKNVVLYFYPKDESPGCTKQACKFRDNYEKFLEYGAEVLGVSSDSLESHAKFSANHNLPFHLLSDSDGQVRRLYGISSTLGLIPGRVTFIIDKEGTVRHIFASQHDAEKHIDESLKVLKEISGQS